MTAQPLYPDDLTRRDKCWNCGESPISSSASRYECRCGCGWTNRFGITPELEKTRREFVEANMARTMKVNLVDFTEPGVLGSPA